MARSSFRCVYRKITPHGYWALKMPNHPRSDPRGWVLEHIVIAEDMHGGPLPEGAVVHHNNHDRGDNRTENLRICASQSEHMRIHAQDRRRDPNQLDLWFAIDQKHNQ